MAYGFSRAARKQVVLAVAQTRRCLFADLPNVKVDTFQENVTHEEMGSFVWLNPEIEIDVAFAEWTRFGTLRHGEFRAGQ